MSVYIAKPLSRNKIRELTFSLRSILGLENNPFFPIVHLLEIVLPEADPEFNYIIESESAMPHEYALCYPEENTIYIREDVYERAVKGVPRDRFTIAHEVGHYIMHTPSRMRLARRNNEEKLPSYLCPEWQANTFAGELLAPAHIVKGMSKSEVAKRCGVSLKVGEIQLNKI